MTQTPEPADTARPPHRMTALPGGPTAAPGIDAAAPLSATDRARMLAHIGDVTPAMQALARHLWSHPELGYQEVESSAAMATLLEEQGFALTRGVAGLPTAFTAEWVSAPPGTGQAEETLPVIGYLAEMDALPGFSQDASPRPSPIPGQANGHACGHHLFGAGAIGAALALQRWLRQTGTPGRVRVYGTPAEEGGAGKAYMARAGLFDDLDVALHWHPDDSNNVWQSRSLSTLSGRFRFHGRTAHAALAPEKGRSALHGVEAFHHMAALMREVVPLHTHIHYVMTEGGRAPNIIPDLAESSLGVRHPDPGVARDIFDRLVAAAEGAAMGTGTRVEVIRNGGVHSILPNDTIGRVIYANMAEAPAITWSEAEYEYARTLQASMDSPPPLDGIDRLGPYAFDRLGAFSSDVGDVSWLAPCGGLGTVTWVPGTAPHTWQAVAAGGTSIGEKGMALAATVLASTGANLLQQPALIARARAEHDRARGPGYVYRPLIGDREPPFDYQRRMAAE